MTTPKSEKPGWRSMNVAPCVVRGLKKESHSTVITSCQGGSEESTTPEIFWLCVGSGERATELQRVSGAAARAALYSQG